MTSEQSTISTDMMDDIYHQPANIFGDAGNLALDYFIHVLAPSVAQYTTSTDGSNGLLTYLLPWALHETNILDAIIAQTLVHIMSCSLAVARAATFFRGKTLNALIQRLNATVDAVAIQIVICMTMVEVSISILSGSTEFRGLDSAWPKECCRHPSARTENDDEYIGRSTTSGHEWISISSTEHVRQLFSVGMGN